ncbi:MAG: hypothetical protein R3Y58_07560 [Eubacteriales bacterium]
MRDKRLEIRLNDGEYENIKTKSIEMNMTVSEYVRYVATRSQTSYSHLTTMKPVKDAVHKISQSYVDVKESIPEACLCYLMPMEEGVEELWQSLLQLD